MSTDLRDMVVTFLEADTELMEHATNGVWFEIADQRIEVDPPYCILAQVPGTPLEFAFQGDSQDWDVWVVKGVGGTKVAEAIDRRCKELLTDAELELGGTVVRYIRPFSVVNYSELADGERYQHVGAQYRIVNERSE